MALVPKLLSPLVHLLFPPLCLHCEKRMKNHAYPFCFSCKEELELLNPEYRCVHCFSLLEEKKMLCENCAQQKAPYKRVASVFEYLSPAGSLVKALKYQSRVDFAKTLAAFMVIQFEQLGWPRPELIVPAPQTWLRSLERGFNQSKLIAEHMSEMLEIEMQDVLKRKAGGFSQNKLSKEARKDLDESLFTLKKNADLSDKVILLIDDVMTTSSTIRCCGKALQEGLPKSIYALTFCFAEK